MMTLRIEYCASKALTLTLEACNESLDLDL